MKVWLAIKMFLTRVQQILMRHSEQRERARQLIEQTRKDASITTSPTRVCSFFFALLILLFHGILILFCINLTLMKVEFFLIEFCVHSILNSARTKDRLCYGKGRENFWQKLEEVRLPRLRLLGSVLIRLKRL